MIYALALTVMYVDNMKNAPATFPDPADVERRRKQWEREWREHQREHERWQRERNEHDRERERERETADTVKIWITEWKERKRSLTASAFALITRLDQCSQSSAQQVVLK